MQLESPHCLHSPTKISHTHTVLVRAHPVFRLPMMHVALLHISREMPSSCTRVVTSRRKNRISSSRTWWSTRLIQSSNSWAASQLPIIRATLQAIWVIGTCCSYSFTQFMSWKLQTSLRRAHVVEWYCCVHVWARGARLTQQRVYIIHDMMHVVCNVQLLHMAAHYTKTMICMRAQFLLVKLGSPPYTTPVRVVARNPCVYAPMLRAAYHHHSATCDAKIGICTRLVYPSLVCVPTYLFRSTYAYTYIHSMSVWPKPLTFTQSHAHAFLFVTTQFIVYSCTYYTHYTQVRACRVPHNKHSKICNNVYMHGCEDTACTAMLLSWEACMYMHVYACMYLLENRAGVHHIDAHTLHMYAYKVFFTCMCVNLYPYINVSEYYWSARACTDWMITQVRVKNYTCSWIHTHTQSTHKI